MRLRSKDLCFASKATCQEMLASCGLGVAYLLRHQGADNGKWGLFTAFFAACVGSFVLK
jgi:hypothetical protein